MRTESLYIHIPFCERLCAYCDFAKVLYDKRTVKNYLQALKKELASIEQPMRTIYIGGGTPSSLSEEELTSLMEMVQPFISERLEEFNVEVNPESATMSKLELLRQYGVTRLSIGVESFQDHLLKRIGRAHTGSQAAAVIEHARELSFPDVSIDMMYGLPGESVSDLCQDLDMISALDLDHLSYYDLILEEGTMLYHQRFAPLDEETDYFYNRLIDERLSRLGLMKYEVSNYAKEGHQSLHNLAYWHYDNYYGVGVGATGKVDDQLITHTRALYKYCRGEDIRHYEKQSLKETMFNHLMMSLRLTAGLDLEDFKRRYGRSLEEVFPLPLKRRLASGDLVIADDHLKTTARSLYYLNDILIDFLDDSL